MIHALAGEQDLRQMGGLKKELPITYWTFLIGALAIAGVPGLAGFFSKDEILFKTFASGHTLLWVVGLLTSLLTAIYMFRLVFLRSTASGAARRLRQPTHGTGTAHAQPRHAARRTVTLHDAPPAMALALVVLAIGSVAGRLRRRAACARRLEPPRGVSSSRASRRMRRASRQRPEPTRRRPQARPSIGADTGVELTLMGCRRRRARRHRHRVRSSS